VHRSTGSVYLLLSSQSSLSTAALAFSFEAMDIDVPARNES
jgi:hypothetical protein